MAQKKAKEKEFKVEFVKDVNDCWSGTAFLANPQTLETRDLHVAVAPGTKALSARAEIRARLKAFTEEFIADHPGFVRMEKEDAEKIYWAARGRKQ